MRLLRVVLAIAVSMLILDLTWLGVIAAPLYDRLLGELRAEQVQPVAAALFYAMYVGAVALVAVRPARGGGEAAARGAGLGFLAYATYELTNWAVIRGWPAALVPIDIAWGVALTAVVARVGWAAR